MHSVLSGGPCLKNNRNYGEATLVPSICKCLIGCWRRLVVRGLDFF